MSEEVNTAHKRLLVVMVCVLMSACSRQEHEHATMPVRQASQVERIRRVSDLPEPTDDELAKDGLTREQWSELTNALALMETYAEDGLARDQVDAKLIQLIHAKLPPEATNVWGITRSLFTQVTEVRFTTTPKGLSEFLVSAPYLPDRLTPGFRAIDDKAKEARSYWRPHELTNVSGCSTNWSTNAGTDLFDCSIMGGVSEDDKVDVYIRVVWEVITNGAR